MVEDGGTRLIVNLNDFLTFNKDHFRKLLNKPHEYIPSFQDAIKDFITFDLGTKESVAEEYHIGFEGSFGSHKVSPRSLQTNLLCSLVCVEGIVTKLSLVRPKLSQSVHYCPATKKHLVKYHRDPTTLFGLPTAPVYPTRDEKGNLLQTEYGMSVFKDYQTLYLQEMPERAPPGQLPRSVEVILENDIVDIVKPGDRVRVMGVYRAMPRVFMSQKTQGVFETILLANNLQLINEEIKGPVITAKDIKNIKEFSTREDAFDLLSQSLAPSIYGHSFIKKALLLQLLGGVEKNLKSSGIHLRGDINILMVGDPGTAKSQLLRYILNVAPLSISTTGRGASGVGLTAAVVHDTETGERRLEAGAMVLADRGIVCIDEFDKMSPEDRVSIHEVMEQQTVTIAKAGIHASLNARCSVLGAANPLYGKYDRSKLSSENIAMPDSLLSRFDLLFVVLDNMEPQNDRNVSEHVLRMHRYNGKVETDSLLQEDEGKGKTSPVFLPTDKLINVNTNRKICSTSFIKKYILYAKSEIKPVLDENAQNKIVDAFSELRNREDTKTLPVTARSLETMIRLSVAHAKSRLSKVVEIHDVNEALKIVRYALYNDSTGGEYEEVEEDDAMEIENDLQADQQTTHLPEVTHAPPIPDEVEIGANKETLIEDTIAKLFKSERKDSFTFDQVYSFVVSNMKGVACTKEDLVSVLNSLHDDEKLFYSLDDNTINRL